MTADHLDLAVGDALGPLQLVRRQHDRRPGGDRLGHQPVDEVPPGLVEPGVGLVEQPQLGPAGDEDGERGAAALAGGELGHRHLPEPAGQAQPLERGVDVAPLGPGGGGPEADVGLDAEVVVQTGGVGQEPDPAADPAAVVAQVVAEDGGVALDDRHEAGAAPQEGGLARPVRTLEQDDLAPLDGEVGPGEGREAADQGDGASEVDGGLHGRAHDSADLPRTTLSAVLTSDPTVEQGDPEPSPAPDERPPSRHRIARVVGAVGRLMMTTGVVILLLVAYQLWGTSLQTNRHQDRLGDEFAALQGSTPATTTPTTTTEAPTTTEGAPAATTPAQPAPTVAPPAVGEPIGSFTIPAIGRNTPYWTVEGDGPEQLKQGAAHYPGTPLPGQAGNAAVAGHRTTYGAPLHDVDDLVPGDEIFFTTLQGEFTYEVREIKIVDPSETSVIQPQNPTPDKPEGEDLLTLTACHPKFSAAERIIVVAELVGNPVPQLEGQAEAADEARELLGEDRGGEESIDAFATEPALTFPGAWWGLVCMLLWGLTRVGALLLRRTKVPWPLAYLVGTPVCLVVLYLFFESFSYEGFARTVGLNI